WQNQKPLRAFARKDSGRFVYLRQAEAQVTLPLPVPHRIRPQALSVHIVFTNSNALLKERSQLKLRLNGGVFAQAALDPTLPDGIIDVDVPLDMLQGGINELTLEVAQHYKSICEDPGSPELWTSIDLDESYVRLVGELAPIPDNLSMLDEWLAYSSWDTYHVSLASLADDPAHLQAGAIIAQGLALRAGEQKIEVEKVAVQQADPEADNALEKTAPESDLVVFGTYKEFERVFGTEEFSSSARSRITLKNRTLGGRIMLMVAAGTQDDLIKAASVFAWMRMPLGASASVDVNDIKLPQQTSYAAPHAVREGREYSFADLGYKNQNMHGLHDQGRIRLWVAPDLFARNHMNVDLKLHFSYGASLRADSVLNVYHNGKFLRGISLGDERGLSISDYLIRIPLHHFRPGMNEFTFESRMHAFTGSNCTTGNTENLLLTVYDDSSVLVPAAEHYLAMPDLNVTMNTGFPYLGDDGSTPVIRIARDNAELVSAAWTLAARLAQLKGLPFAHIEIGPKVDGRNVLYLASVRDVPASLWNRAPVNLGDKGQINHPLMANPASLGHRAMTWREKFAVVFGSEEEKLAAANYTAAVQQSFNLLNYGVLMQMENPSRAGGTLTMLVADNDTMLKQAVARLVELWPEMHDVQGDVLVWGQAADATTPDYWSSSLSEKKYYIGSMSYWQRMQYFAIQYPLFLIALLLGMFVFMALLTRWLLMGHRRNTHPHADL
ncbi:MAG: cellulose biosynthesis cyclic di-GMP-binding regulatory protein BcsB, partial [Mariprofundaceae bacterium]